VKPIASVAVRYQEMMGFAALYASYELEMSLCGTASWYLKRREALRRRQTAA
jgi:hypothetical protein